MRPLAVVPRGLDASARRLASRDGSIRWCRFNDETIYWRHAEDSSDLPDELQRLGGPPQHLRGDLYLVVQVGNAFVAEFPAVPIVISKGRYLAVDLTPDEAAELERHPHACFGFCPLPQDMAVLDTLARSRRSPDTEIAALTASVSQEKLALTLSVLTTFRTRHSLSPDFSDAADWCAAQLASAGFSVAKIPITVGQHTSFNTVADRRGTGGNRRLVLVTAHLDSVNIAGGLHAPAPGADDNGSGVAGALEIARVLGNRTAAHDLRIILFGGEEQGLHGSQQYVSALPPAERARVDAVINMDMIARLNTAVPTVLLEGAALSQPLMREIAEAAHAYTSLQVQTSLHPFASDHVPFINASLPALLTIEGADSTNHDVHTANDTLDKIHYDLARQIVQANLAVVASRLGMLAAGLRPSSSPVVAWGANRLDVFVPGTNRALYHKWWNGSAWGPSLTGYEAMGCVITAFRQQPHQTPAEAAPFMPLVPFDKGCGAHRPAAPR